MNTKSNGLVSVIIVTAGRGNYLRTCLDSIKEQAYPSLEVIVVDNSTDDNFNRGILALWPEIRIYTGGKNLFYCEALNKGIEISDSEFVLCLNDDVILEKDFFKTALKGFSISERIGMVSAKILRQDKQTIDSTGLFLTFWRTAKERGYGRKDRGTFQREGYIFGVNGAVALYRRKMLEEIKEEKGYFDPDFHIFYEDLDIAWRASRKGWKGYYVPSAVAYHVRGATVRQGTGLNKPYARRYLNDDLHLDLIKNRYLAIIKNETLISFLWHAPAIFFYDLILWSYLLIFNPGIIKKYFYNLKYLNFALKTRMQSFCLFRRQK